MPRSLSGLKGSSGDMSGHAQGGNDTFRSASASQLTFYGDAGGNMSGHARGGDDVAVLAFGQSAPARKN
jgi:signal recognition particle GTPase